MRYLFLLTITFLVGCSSSPKAPKTETIIISPIGSSSRTVVETTGNLTRIYSIKKESQ